MPVISHELICDLHLDLSNFRTVPQKDEIGAIHAMVSISPDCFWALLSSLLDDGYLPTENILVLNSLAEDQYLVVMEGNRRIAALKLIHGYIPTGSIDIPDELRTKIASLTDEWKEQNKVVPCTIYSLAEADVVSKIVTLAHGKGEKASRDQWSAVARARHNRKANMSNESALDLLEKYLEIGTNLSRQQAARWAGNYPLTVLEEAIKKSSTRFGAKNASELARIYPGIQFRNELDELMLHIGLEKIRFPQIRGKEDVFAKYGIPSLPETTCAKSVDKTITAASKVQKSSVSNYDTPKTQEIIVNQTKKPASIEKDLLNHSMRKQVTAPIADPRSVKRMLKSLKPVGGDRQKVVTLCNEALMLDLSKNPIAFCMLLRSMFEISVKAFCNDHRANGGPSAMSTDGSDRRLVEVLRDIYSYLTKASDKKHDLAMTRMLHGAMVELGKSEGILSVTSMNQLVHNPSFSVTSNDICTVFGNVYPFLTALNQ